MMTLYVFPVSPFCDKIRRVLHLKGVAYRTKEVSLMSTLRRYKRINPTGKVPCLEHDGRRVGDSTNIALYLEERFPTPSIFPTHPAERALCQVLEDWADESLYYYQKRLKFTIPANAKVWTPRFSEYDSPAGRLAMSMALVPRQRQQLYHQGLGRKALRTILDDVDRLMDDLSKLVDGRTFLVGDTLSIADIAVCAQLTSLREAPEGAQSVERHPTILAWMQRVDERTSTPTKRPAPPPRARATSGTRASC